VCPAFDAEIALIAFAGTIARAVSDAFAGSACSPAIGVSAFAGNGAEIARTLCGASLVGTAAFVKPPFCGPRFAARALASGASASTAGISATSATPAEAASETDCTAGIPGTAARAEAATSRIGSAPRTGGGINSAVWVPTNAGVAGNSGLSPGLLATGSAVELSDQTFVDAASGDSGSSGGTVAPLGWAIAAEIKLDDEASIAGKASATGAWVAANGSGISPLLVVEGTTTAAGANRDTGLLGVSCSGGALGDGFSAGTSRSAGAVASVALEEVKPKKFVVLVVAVEVSTAAEGAEIDGLPAK
jgi:hypothetical protein